MKRVMLVTLVLAVSPLAAVAQQASTAPETNPVSNALRIVVDREGKNLVAGAEEMPADKYSYHPTPEQMTFAHLIAHIGQSNDFLCSTISGEAPPADSGVTDKDSKEKLVEALKASFDYCAKVLAKVDDSDMGKQVPLFGKRKGSQASGMLALGNDLFDHYSQEAIYLRMNGLLPPTAQPQKK